MTTATEQKTENTTETRTSPEEKQKRIENHRKTSVHLNEASKHHLEAAKHYEADSHEKAAKSTLTAQGHLILANEAQREEAKNYASSSTKQS